MRLRLTAPLLLAAICCTHLEPAPSRAQDSSALINKALDEQVKLNLDTTLRQAMKSITSQTGVRIETDPAVWELLPWGEDTNVKAKIENHTLRESLAIILSKLGLAMTLRDEAVEIQPMPGLRRLAQRASQGELRALDYLASTPANIGDEHPTLKALLEAVDTKLAAAGKPDLGIEDRIGDLVKRDKAVFVPRNATLMDALESIARETRATWYPWGGNIVVTSKEERTRRLLEKPMTLRPGERGVELTDALVQLSTRSGVAFELQPGLAQAVAPDAREVRNTYINVPVRQILEAICATTGVSYTIQDDKVALSTAANPAQPAGPRDPAIGILQLDNGLQLLLPASQVPPDVREFLKYKAAKEIEKIRQMMKEEGWKPAPPATKPAGDGAL